MTKKELIQTIRNSANVIPQKAVAKFIKNREMYSLRVACEHKVGTTATNEQILKIAIILGIINP